MVVCLTGARFTMKADVLRWSGITTPQPTDVDQSQGGWQSPQDPITGEVRNEWVPGVVDNPDTPDKDEYEVVRTIDCLARGIVDGGIRVAGSTERFGDLYENIEFVKLWVPQRVKIYKNDRITNIRTRGEIIWTESNGDAIVFNVNGISPLFDAFNRPVEKFLLLERAEQ